MIFWFFNGTPLTFESKRGIIPLKGGLTPAMKKAKVIDAPCGYGKTSWAIKTINEHPEKSYIYCTPFLDEIERIRNECGIERFVEPNNYGTSKIEDFNKILASGKSVAVTHVTFLNATEETIQLIYEGGYTLILDEVLDVICEFNSAKTVEDAPEQKMQKVNVKFLMDFDLIRVRDDFSVEWTGPDYEDPEFKFYEVMRFAKMNRLYIARKKLLVTVFPSEMFKQFEDVFILTYMFDGSMLDSYFKIFDLPTEISTIKDGQITYFSDCADKEFKEKCKALINIYDGKLNRSDRTLSKSWYMNATATEIKQLKNDLRTYFTKVLSNASAQQGDILWTCPVDFKDKIKGPYYTKIRDMTKEERELPEREYRKLDKLLSCFASCNAKATNIYGNRYALAYCCNMFMNPLLKGLVQDLGIQMSDEKFALSCIVQWICRSRIRNDQPIEVYIPSSRMRNLLIDWLNS